MTGKFTKHTASFSIKEQGYQIRIHPERNLFIHHPSSLFIHYNDIKKVEQMKYIHYFSKSNIFVYQYLMDKKFTQLPFYY